MSKIKNLEDLEAEKLRLMALLKNHEEAIRTDMAGVREGLKPVGNAVNVINKMATRDNTGPLLNFGLEMGVDVFIRRMLLARAGWFAKIVVPYVLKNYSSHLLGEEKREALLAKIKGFFNKIRPNPNPDPEPPSTVYSGADNTTAGAQPFVQPDVVIPPNAQPAT